MKRVFLMMLLVCLAVFFLDGSLGATSYYYQDLTKQGVPTGTDYYPNAINDARQIVGYSYEFSTTTYKAFLWDPGKGLLQLQTLGGKDCRAIAINKLGQIAGVADPSTGLSQACLWTDPLQAPTALGTLAGHTSSRAHAINDGGVIVGDSSGTFTHACKWTAPLLPTDLGTLGGSTSSAMGINNAGQIVGSATNSSGHSRACLWNQGPPGQDLAASLPDGNAIAINSQGNVVGNAQFTPGMGMGRTYFWNHLTAAFQDLFPQAYESWPYGISNADQVLSYVGFSPGTCLWTSANGQQELNQLVVNLPPGVTLDGPLYAAISPKGYITGVDSQRHLFLLTPIAAPAGVDLLLLN